MFFFFFPHFYVLIYLVLWNSVSKSSSKVLLWMESTLPNSPVLHKNFHLPLNAWHKLGSAFFLVCPSSLSSNHPGILPLSIWCYVWAKAWGEGWSGARVWGYGSVAVLDDWCECVPFINCSDDRHRSLANGSEAVTKIAEPIADCLPTI